MNHLNYDVLRYQIVYRAQLTTVETDYTTGESVYRTVWSKWWLYSRDHGTSIINRGADANYNPKRLQDKISRLEKRHPNREYKVVVIHDTREVRDIEQL